MTFFSLNFFPIIYSSFIKVNLFPRRDVIVWSEGKDLEYHCFPPKEGNLGFSLLFREKKNPSLLCTLPLAIRHFLLSLHSQAHCKAACLLTALTVLLKFISPHHPWCLNFWNKWRWLDAYLPWRLGIIWCCCGQIWLPWTLSFLGFFDTTSLFCPLFSLLFTGFSSIHLINVGVPKVSFLRCLYFSTYWVFSSHLHSCF